MSTWGIMNKTIGDIQVGTTVRITRIFNTTCELELKDNQHKVVGRTQVPCSSVDVIETVTVEFARTYDWFTSGLEK